MKNGPIISPIIAPKGKAKLPIAVAIALSLSPNQLVATFEAPLQING